MAVDRIVAWLKLRDVARFRADAWRAAQALKGIGRAAKEGDSPLNQLGGALSQLSSNLPEYTGRTRVFGFAIGTVLSAFALLIPIIVSAGGSLVALAGSFGAAAIGAGLLAVAVAGVALPLATFGLVALQAFKGFSKVSTAFQNWQKQVAAFGKNSTQAETALKRLHGTAAIFGGSAMIKAAKTWNDLQDSFRKENAPALRDLLHILVGVLHTVKNILPLFATMAHIVGMAMNEALKPFRDMLESAEFRRAMMDLANSFAGLAGPLVRAAVNFLMGFLFIASRLTNYLPGIADSILKVSTAFRDWAKSGDLGVLVGHFFAWWNLLKAVGGLLFVILNTGASDGKSLVDTLTEIVNRWTAWLSTTKGQNSLRKFFHDAVSSTKVFIGVIAGLAKVLFWFGRTTMGPLASSVGLVKNVWNQLMDALKPAEPFWKNVLAPLLKGIAEGVLSGIVGAFKFAIFTIKILSTVLGFLAKPLGALKPLFYGVGFVIGFILGGWILKLLAALAKMTVILRPLALLFRLLAVPIEFAGGVVGKLVGWFAKLADVMLGRAFRAFPLFRSAVESVVRWLTGAGARFFDIGVRLWTMFKRGFLRAIGQGLGFAGDIGKAIYNWIAGRINHWLPDKIKGPGPLPDLNLPHNPLPLLASGGVVSGSGSWITGEAGPEINTLTGGRVVVQPLSPAVAAQSSNATLAPYEPRILVSKIYLKGKQIAEAVADEAADDRARKGKHG